jgi:hypothetical protein
MIHIYQRDFCYNIKVHMTDVWRFLPDLTIEGSGKYRIFIAFRAAMRTSTQEQININRSIRFKEETHPDGEI